MIPEKRAGWAMGGGRAVEDNGEEEGVDLSKTFTLDEAQTLLPVLGALLDRARESATRAGTLNDEMQELSQRIFLSGGLHVDVPAAARRRAEREKALGEVRGTIEEIEEIGARVAENETGMLEFPCEVEGRVVLLCWTQGEEGITQWREEDDAADVRRPVDGRFSRRERDRLN